MGDQFLSLRVVTVDDSPIVAERLQIMLSEMDIVEYLGNAVSIAAAHNMIDRVVPNVVILDINLKADMLVANGVQLLIQLRRKYPRLTIIMLTNLSGPQYRSTCLTLGADYFFDKTNDFEKIAETLKEIRNTRCRKENV